MHLIHKEGAQQVTGLVLFDWFYSGAREVIGDSSYLNSINVFPVPDGDTGSNMAATLRAMVSIPVIKPDFNSALKDISHNGMSGARGNSGVILAAYINGMAQEAEPFETPNISEFAHIARSAVSHMYEAIENPVEGTIVTVIHAWADALVKCSDTAHSFHELLRGAYSVAQASVENTKMQLEILKKNNVVDSGAAGFLSFLQGINRCFSHANVSEPLSRLSLRPQSFSGQDLKFRYCVEALIEPKGPLNSSHMAEEIAKLKGALGHLGDSIIATSYGGQIKLHLHTNDPEKVIAKAAEFGHLASQKADDMVMQTEMHSATKQKIGILTDSAADISKDFKLEHHIGTLNLGVLIGDEVFLDKQTITLEQVFLAMDVEGVYPTSSQAEPARVVAALESMLESFDQVLVLSVASELSGTYQSFIRARENLGQNKERITVMDTRLNSGAQGLVVMQAAKMIQAGESFEDILSEIEELITRTKIYVCLNTLAYAVRGGRVPNSIGKIGSILKLRPIMSLDTQGRGIVFGAAFSQRGLTNKIFKLVKKAQETKGIKAYCIVHGNNLPLAKAYAQQLVHITGKDPEYISEISAAIALHAGPGTVAVCYTEEKE